MAAGEEGMQVILRRKKFLGLFSLRRVSQRIQDHHRRVSSSINLEVRCIE